MEQLQFQLKNFQDSPILFNRRRFMIELEHDQSLSKQKGESAYQHQMRIFKKKAEFSPDGKVIITGNYFKKAFSYSQRQTCCPIKPAGTSKKNGTLTQALSALFIDDIKTNYTEADLQPYEDICCIAKGMNKSLHSGDSSTVERVGSHSFNHNRHRSYWQRRNQNHAGLVRCVLWHR